MPTKMRFKNSSLLLRVLSFRVNNHPPKGIGAESQITALVPGFAQIYILTRPTGKRAETSDCKGRGNTSRDARLGLYQKLHHGIASRLSP